MVKNDGEKSTSWFLPLLEISQLGCGTNQSSAQESRNCEILNRPFTALKRPAQYSPQARRYFLPLVPLSLLPSLWISPQIGTVCQLLVAPSQQLVRFNQEYNDAEYNHSEGSCKQSCYNKIIKWLSVRC